MNPQNSPTPSGPAGGSTTGERSTEGGASLTDTKNQITQGARDAAAKVKGVATQTATRAKEEVGRYANTQKETAAGRIGSYSSAIHETARSLEEKDPNIAWFSHQAADKLQSVADYMRSRDFGMLRHDAEDIARRHPAAFFGGMFLAGLVLGNVVKASRRKLDESEDSREMGYESEWMQNRGDRDEAIEGGLGDSALTQSERNAAGI
jgi:hypothetical protein